MRRQDPQAGDPVSGDSSSGGSPRSAGGTEGSPPAQVPAAEDAAWGPRDIAGERGPWMRGEWSCAPGQEAAWGAEPLQNGAWAVDHSSWGSPELVRRDSSLEPPCSLPLTPGSGAPSPRSLDASLLPAGLAGLPCDLGAPAMETAPWWAGSWWAADGPQRASVVGGRAMALPSQGARAGGQRSWALRAGTACGPATCAAPGGRQSP
ncbi:Pericentrin [Galemys pyrenaicus]|uniref:Pericentrin n=1 Tax=Galemys pyrenaicus TaxID=202257 RepID=A0A8J6DQ33_GALPY|nr:Pericentrin [Galemys pyrenaicus]